MYISRTLVPGKSLAQITEMEKTYNFHLGIFHLDRLTHNDLKKQFLSNACRIAKKASFAKKQILQTLCTFISALRHIKLNWLYKKISC